LVFPAEEKRRPVPGRFLEGKATVFQADFKPGKSAGIRPKVKTSKICRAGKCKKYVMGKVNPLPSAGPGGSMTEYFFAESAC
jgi:hypothetical protein